MAKLDLARFVETAGSMLIGQRQGELQAQQLLRQQQDENYKNQIEALNLRRQVEAANAEQDRQKREDAFRYALPNVAPQDRAAAAEHILGLPAPTFGGIPGLQVPPGRAYAGVGQILAPTPAPAMSHPLARAAVSMATAPAPAPVAPAPAELHQPAMLRALKGMSNLLPGGADVMRALHPQLTLPTAPAAAPPLTAPPPAAPQMVNLFGKEFRANVVDPREWARLQADYGRVLKDFEGVTDPATIAQARVFLGQWNPNPQTGEEFGGNQQILSQLRSLGLGSGAPAERLRNTEKGQAVREFGQRWKGLRSLTPEEGAFELPSFYQAVADARQQGIGMPAYLDAYKDRIGEITRFQQTGDRKSAERVSAEVLAAIRQGRSPEAETRATSAFLRFVSGMSNPSPVNVTAAAKKFGLDYLVSGLNASGLPGGAKLEQQFQTALARVPQWARLDRAAQQPEMENLEALARVTGRRDFHLPAQILARINPAERDRLSLSWARFRLQQHQSAVRETLAAAKRSNMPPDAVRQETRLMQIYTGTKPDYSGQPVYTHPQPARAAAATGLRKLGKQFHRDYTGYGLGDYSGATTPPLPAPGSGSPQGGVNRNQPGAPKPGAVPVLSNDRRAALIQKMMHLGMPRPAAEAYAAQHQGQK